MLLDEVLVCVASGCVNGVWWLGVGSSLVLVAIVNSVKSIFTISCLHVFESREKRLR